MSLKRVKQMVRGAGRLFDFSGSYGRSDYTILKSRMEKTNRTDREKLLSDWHTVGRDMWKVMNQHQDELHVSERS